MSGEAHCFAPGDSVGSQAWFIAATKAIRELRDVRRPDRLVLLFLASFANAKGWCRLHVMTIGERIGLKNRAVQYSLARLVEAGYLDRVFRYVDLGGRGRRVVQTREPPGKRGKDGRELKTLNLASDLRVLPKLEVLPAPRRSPSTRDPNILHARRPTGAKEPIRELIEAAQMTLAALPPPVHGVVHGIAPKERTSLNGGSETSEISETIHPCTNLARARSTPPATPPPPPPPTKEAPPPAGETPAPAPVGRAARGPRFAELVILAAKLFETHAAMAPRAIERLEDLGLTDTQIASTLRRAARDRSIQKSEHPLLLAVWRVEHAWRTVGPPNPAIATPAPFGEQQSTRTITIDEIEKRMQASTPAERIARMRVDAGAQRPRGGGEVTGGEEKEPKNGG